MVREKIDRPVHRPFFSCTWVICSGNYRYAIKLIFGINLSRKIFKMNGSDHCGEFEIDPHKNGKKTEQDRWITE